MVKYNLAALALKGFSSCEPARTLYRGLGNWLGGRKRATGKMPSYDPSIFGKILRQT
jgi:hypothetical protein